MIKPELRDGRPIVLVISGPAGSGKTTLVEGLVEKFSGQIQRVITTTTRAPRQGEVDGVDYHFLSQEVFKTKVAEGAFYEWAEVHSNAYGTLKSSVNSQLETGFHLILNIDVQGAASFRQVVQQDPLFLGRLVTVFIMPASVTQLRERLRLRALDAEATVEKRLKNAEGEMALWRDYDYCILTGRREHDADCLSSIFQAECLRVPPSKKLV